LFRRRQSPRPTTDTDTMLSLSKESLAESTIDSAASEPANTEPPPAVSSCPNPVVPGALVHDRFLAFLAHSSQTVLGSAAVPHGECARFVQALTCLAKPPSDDVAPLQYVADVTRDIVGSFGYAVAETGQWASETACILLRYLRPPARTALALQHMTDDQATRILTATSGDGELHRLDICLQLLHACILAMPSDTPPQSLLDPAMATASLQPLLDLTLVAGPLADHASRVLQLMLQRIDDTPYPRYADRTPSAAIHGELRWYESDPAVLVDTARTALCRMVAQGMNQYEKTRPAADDARDYSPSGPSGGLAMEPLDFASVRSESPEMPVLVIPKDNHDQILSAAGSETESTHEQSSSSASSSSSSSDAAGFELMDQLDQFDRELDEALLRD
ncbi:hypothetical protein EV175_006411, partial [Coemansia sp. RSA 1933]